ncbi:MAG: ATP-binding protein [bacterium]
MSIPEQPSALPSDPAIRALLEAGGVWLWDANLVDELTTYQEGFWEQYGYDPNSVEETFDFLRVMENEDKRDMARAWRAHLEGEAPLYEAEWRLRTPSGERRWISSRGKVIARDADGRPTRMVGTYRDITESKVASISLASSVAELDAVFRGTRDGLALVSPELEILRLNDRAEELLRTFTGVEVRVGTNVFGLPGLANERPVLGDLVLALAGNKIVPERLLHLPRTDSWVECTYAPVHFSDGSVLGVVITIRDVTERKRLEQSRMQALRLESMGLMAGGIAHDFNNLLGAIVGNIDVAKLSITDAETIESLDDARAAAGRAAELVQQLLAFAGQHEPIVRPVDLSELTGEIVRYARRIPGPEIVIEEELPLGLPTINADPTQLRQLVLNLLVNALDAVGESQGRIQVRTSTELDPRGCPGDLVVQPRPAPCYLTLTVSDSGPGMPEDTRARIFDPFFSTKPAGHGLGLSTVLGVVRSHGGTVSVTSSPGAGASFTVFLPAS